MGNIESNDVIVNRIKEQTARSQIMRSYPKIDIDKAYQYFYDVAKLQCDNYVVDEYNIEVIKTLCKWLNGDEFNAIDPRTNDVIKGDFTKGIFLIGKTGTGKTLLMKIANLLSRAFQNRYMYKGYDDNLITKRFNWVSYNANDATFEYMRNGTIMPFLAEQYLQIDDLGVESEKNYFNGNCINVLKTIIEVRGDMPNKFTNFTSNLSLKMIENRYGDRVVSRICKMCNIIYLGGVDRRK